MVTVVKPGDDVRINVRNGLGGCVDGAVQKADEAAVLVLTDVGSVRSKPGLVAVPWSNIETIIVTQPA